MNVRRGMTQLFALSLVAVAFGCASGGGANPQGFETISQPVAGDDLPAWVLALPEGDPPRDNDQTAMASLFLLQAAQASDPLRAEGLYQQALDAAREGIQADPTNAQPYFQAGEALVGLDNHAEAGAMFARAEEIFPRYIMETDYIRELAWIEAYNEGVELLLGGTGDPTAAFARAHAVFQGRPEAMVQLASLYTQQERFGDAIDLYTEAVAVIEGPRRERIEDAAILAEWDQAREVALFNLGELAFQEQRFAEAVAAYERLRVLLPEDQTVVSNLAASYASAGQGDRAQALYDELLRRPGLTARDFINIGLGLAQGGNDAEAARAFAAAHEAIPQDLFALYNYAQSLYFAAQADSTQAAALYTELVGVGERLVAVDTHGRNAYQILATALVQTSQEQQAGQVLDRFQNLPFGVSGTYMGALPDGVAVVGRVTNQLGTPGSTVRLRMHFYDLQGAAAGTQDFTVTLGAVDEGVDFQVDLQTSREIAGYRYEVLN